MYDDKKLCPTFARQHNGRVIWTLFRGNEFIHLAILNNI